MNNYFNNLKSQNLHDYRSLVEDTNLATHPGLHLAASILRWAKHSRLLEQNNIQDIARFHSLLALVFYCLETESDLEEVRFRNRETGTGFLESSQEAIASAAIVSSHLPILINRIREVVQGSSVENEVNACVYRVLRLTRVKLSLETCLHQREGD